ncbi:MAG: hypothetical protein ACFE8U_02035 [Candidatus Hermodarchaeota archaeon]
MPTTQRTAHFFRIIYIILFVFATLLVIGIPPIDFGFFSTPSILVTSIDPSMFEFAQVFSILDYILLIFQGVIIGLASLALIITLSISSALSNIPIIGDIFFTATSSSASEMLSLINTLLDPNNRFFPHSSITPDPLTLIADFSHFFGATAILILLPVALVSGVGFLQKGDTKLAIYSFLGFQLIVIIAIFTENILISTSIDTSNLIAMVLSPIFTLGFFLYLLLEIAFQTSYMLNIIEPMTEREKRIQEHLKRIRTFVPQPEQLKGEKEQTVQSIQTKRFDLLAASYLREMVERRVFKKGEVARDDKSMMRLQSYLASLNQSDSRTDQKLAAQTAQPDISALIKHFAPAMIFRIAAVILLSYFIMAPKGILNFFVAASFPALLKSLELGQPEFQTIAILNVALIFIVVSAILHYLTTSRRTKQVLERVVQQIDTLVDFDRGPKATTTPSDLADEEDMEEPPSDEEEEIS